MYTSHLLLDFFTLDTGAPYGIPLFWPFSQETYQSHWPVLPNVQHTSGPLLSVHNLMLVLREAAVLLPAVGLVLTLKVHGRFWPRGMAWLLGASSFAAACISALTVR
ncbi:MAG: metal-dependent hydrolase [candidate division KSB1 bacterium]|nr:metal-dependent hydrolase [candidate division KSB1 bacterium]